MKKFVLLLVAVTTSLMVHARTNFSVGVEAGWNLSHPVDATSWRSGFLVGVNGELSLTHHWYVDASLRLMSKPWKVTDTFGPDNMWDENMTTLKSTTTATPYSLNIPIHAGYRFGLSNTVNMTVGVGPYFGIGLFGKEKFQVKHTSTTGQLTNDKESFNIFSDKNFGMKRFEVGVDAKVGVEILSHYSVWLGYQYQFNDPAKRILPVSNQQTLTLGLGYKF